MLIELYEKYKLKDGRTGRAVELLGDRKACIFEVDKKGFDEKVITVLADEIEKKL
jgi:hypothetical protein|nr:MAG TPA: hypothetical protein [Caudoviricetes sp.]